MRIGIDLGGTKTEAIALGDSGAVLSRLRRPSPQGNYDATVRSITQLVKDLESDLNIRGSVGIGIPGALSPASGKVKNANSTWLIGQAFDCDLAESLGRPVRIANDANCFALSEASDGAAAGVARVFGVILGTGVGGGLVIDGQVLEGRNAIAGEWGHNTLPWMTADEHPGGFCYCGKRGCIETFLSGSGLIGDYQSRGGVAGTAESVIEAAELGNQNALDSLERYQDRLARALASVVNVFDPDAIVLGGGLSNVESLYATVPPLLSRYAFSDQIDTPVLPPMHGDSSGVRGAAWLWSLEDAPAGLPKD